MGFKRCPTAPCLYYFQTVVDDETMFIILCVHVDDGFMVSNSSYIIDHFYDVLSQHFTKVNLLRDFCKYLGIETIFDKEKGTILCHHSNYITNKFSAFDDPADIPMSSSINLRKAVPNQHNPPVLSDTGSFRFVCDRARPDVLCATGEVSTGGAKDPSDLHWKVCGTIKDYLTSTHDVGLKFGGRGTKLNLFAYVDASYITETDSKSRLGGCLFMNLFSGAILSFSRRAILVAHSSTEAELMAIDIIILEILALLDILEFLEIELDEPVRVFIDNKSAIDLVTTLKNGHKNKIFNRKINSIREAINFRKIVCIFVPSPLNVADTLTKPLPVVPYQRHTGIMLTGHDGVDPEEMILQWLAEFKDQQLHVALTHEFLLDTNLL